MVPPSNALFNPTLAIGCGGFGNLMLAALSERIHRRHGGIPSNFRRIFYDFKSDQLTLGKADAARIPTGLWESFRPHKAETAFIGRTPEQHAEIIALIKRGDPNYTFLNEIMPVELVERLHGSSEAAQNHDYGMWCAAAGEQRRTRNAGAADSTLAAHVAKNLELLRPNGRAHADMLRANLGEHIETSRVLALVCIGAEGGTGGGPGRFVVPLAIRDYARRHGVEVEMHLHYMAGNYRACPADEAEFRGSLCHRYVEEIENSMRPNTYSRFRIGPHPQDQWTHLGPLVDRVFPRENHGLLYGDPAAALQQFSRSAEFSYFSRAANSIRRNWVNIEARERIA